MKVKGNQNPAVLFSLLSSVRSLDIESSQLCQWMKYITKIGPCLRVLSLYDYSIPVTNIVTVTEYCPYLEKLSWSFESRVSNSDNILQSIASNCPHLRCLTIELYYNNNAECDADLAAFAEQCPQLEELSLTCEQLTEPLLSTALD